MRGLRDVASAMENLQRAVSNVRPVLKSLLDKLFEKKVLTDPERESADEMQNRGDKARFVIDTVRRKGEAASSEKIEFLREVDPFLCEHIGLI
uniref:CARD domain-containing protein n=1 Tax=Sparus aurata TaxID=8175 RepID=A0A671XAD6_SPAAU